MSKKKHQLFGIFILLWFSFSIAKGQSLGFEMPKGKGKIDIPFEYQNGFILLRVDFNHSFPLRFVFDTGAEYTILTKREITDLLAIPYGRSFKVMGSDLQTTLTAYLVKGINLKTGQAEARKKDILVLEDDYFRFEEFTGTEVHGIIGADLFRRFVVKINYQRRVISLYNPRYFKLHKPEKYEKLDINIYKGKPYLSSTLFMNPSDSLNCKLLLDTGASLALLLNTHTDARLTLPPNVVKSNIGAGLGGFIEGYIGRIQAITIGKSKLVDVTTNFQENTEYMNQDSTVLHRNGIVGNEILSRFTLYIDYPQHKLYLKPNRRIKQKFIFDKSGLTLITAGQLNNTIIVQNVLPGSPAAEAGIYRGDIVKAINGIPVAFLSLKNAHMMLRSKTGKTINLRLERLGYPIKRSLVLRDLI